MIFLAHISSYSTKPHMPQCIHTYVTAIHPLSSQSSVVKPQHTNSHTFSPSAFPNSYPSSRLSLSHTHTPPQPNCLSHLPAREARWPSSPPANQTAWLAREITGQLIQPSDFLLRLLFRKLLDLHHHESVTGLLQRQIMKDVCGMI